MKKNSVSTLPPSPPQQKTTHQYTKKQKHNIKTTALKIKIQWKFGKNT